MDELHPIDIAARRLGSQSALAAVLGVTKGAVSQWKEPDRAVPIQHCAAIEAATGGEVTRKMLRPDDWHRIWPELASSVPEALPAHQPAEVRNAA